METIVADNWESTVVSLETVTGKIKPGMSIFLGTAGAEPRTMVRHLMTAEAKNLEDLELIQLVSFGDAISLQTLQSQKFRLTTFFSGWVANEAIEEGRVDMIPSRFVKIPQLIESRLSPVDVAVVQITPPNEAGYCSLGIAVDVAREALEQAAIGVGEINTQIPCTFGDTFVHVSEFDFLVRSADPPIYLERWKTNEIWDQVALNVGSLID
jgi:acyl-CoA hydrolase